MHDQLTPPAPAAPYLICRPCKGKIRALPGQRCPQCHAALQAPAASYQNGFPTIAGAALDLEDADIAPTIARLPQPRCIYCGFNGADLTGDGPRKSCTDQIACAERVRGNSPRPLRVVAPARSNGTPAQALIDLMQRNANVAELDGPVYYADTLHLPIEALQNRNVLFGKPGCGKTNAGAVIAENCITNNVPLCVIDKLGNMWGLRARGLGDALSIPIIGGQHGDVPLDRDDGGLLATIFASGLSMIIDLSQLALEDQQYFAAAFFAELLVALRRPAHVLIEEAETICPAFSRSKSQFAALGAVSLWARQIRNFGVGWTFSTQRPQLLHPDVIDASSAFLAMQSTGVKAQQSIRNEARTRLGNVIADAILDELGQLSRGEAWLLPDPNWLDTEASAPMRFRFRERSTYNSTIVPKIGQPMVAPPKLRSVDVRALKALKRVG